MRSAAALSKEALAERAGLSKRAISDLERGARLAARYADLWNATFTSEHGTRNQVERIPGLRKAVDAACVEVGRDPATLGRTAGVFVQSVPDVALIWEGSPPLRERPRN